MIKKIFLALILYCVLTSCGKKGDPEYKESEKKANNQLLFIYKT
tara:strand:+ start:150 stop:281 length:132 start_codon:yes stop_codon:yes gene_type:complete